MMTIFEPLFILLFLAAVATLFTAGFAALRGELPRALRILRRLGIAAAFYFTVVLVVAFAAVPPMHGIGEPQCFDDWCITVTDAKKAAAGSSQNWTVALRISSRAKRVQQRERGAAVHLVDSRGRKFYPIAAGADVPLDVQVGPGESADAARRFELPADASDIRLVYNHEGGFPIGDFIIGENQLFHDATVIKLENASR
jgi:hypothetical protein